MNITPPQIPVLPVPLEQRLPHLAASLDGGGAVKIVALGSSTTAGEGGIVPYPHRLEMMLRDSYPNHTIDILNRGIRGEEAPKERDRIEKDVIAEKPSLVIWQLGTNAVWQSASDDPPSHDETIKALRCGIACLQKKGTIDIVLMDLQYLPALLTPATIEATNKMVGAINEVARDMKVNLFRRFELMKGWNERAKICFDRMVNPDDDRRLHQSEWATHQVSYALRTAIFDAVRKSPAVAQAPKPLFVKALECQRSRWGHGRG